MLWHFQSKKCSFSETMEALWSETGIGLMKWDLCEDREIEILGILNFLKEKFTSSTPAAWHYLLSILKLANGSASMAFPSLMLNSDIYLYISMIF